MWRPARIPLSAKKGRGGGSWNKFCSGETWGAPQDRWLLPRTSSSGPCTTSTFSACLRITKRSWPARPSASNPALQGSNHHEDAKNHVNGVAVVDDEHGGQLRTELFAAIRSAQPIHCPLWAAKH